MTEHPIHDGVEIHVMISIKKKRSWSDETMLAKESITKEHRMTLPNAAAKTAEMISKAWDEAQTQLDIEISMEKLKEENSDGDQG